MRTAIGLIVCSITLFICVIVGTVLMLNILNSGIYNTYINIAVLNVIGSICGVLGGGSLIGVIVLSYPGLKNNANNANNANDTTSV